MLKRTGASTHPCFTRLATPNSSESSSSKQIFTGMPLCSSLISCMYLGGQSHFSRTAHRSSLSTESNALARDLQLQKPHIDLCAALYTSPSIVCQQKSYRPLTGLLGIRIGSRASDFRTLKIQVFSVVVMASTLPSSKIPRLFPHTALSPLFFCMGVMRASFQLLGMFSPYHILRNRLCRYFRIERSPPTSSSEGTNSGPGAFRGVNPSTAWVTSSRIGGRSRCSCVRRDAPGTSGVPGNGPCQAQAG